MKKLAIATAAAAMLATPAMAQFVGGYVAAPSYEYGYSYGPTYGYVQAQPYGYAAPFGTFYAGSAYDRNLDIATEPDPNIRGELRRDQTLNLDLRP
jgi:hypothetical protein